MALVVHLETQEVQEARRRRRRDCQPQPPRVRLGGQSGRIVLAIRGCWKDRRSTMERRLHGAGGG